MLNSVRVITTPTADTPGTCLLVHHDNRRYLFGHIAEGTQRAFVQQKISLSRIEEVFLSGPVNWKTAGGLLGMILSIAEVVSSRFAAAAEEAAQKSKRQKQQQQKEKEKEKGSAKKGDTEKAKTSGKTSSATDEIKGLGVHGSENLKYLLATARRFVFRKGLPIHPHEVRSDTPISPFPDSSSSSSKTARAADWADDNIMVWYVPVAPDGSSSSSSSSSSSIRSSSSSSSSSNGRKRSHEAMEGESEAEKESDEKVLDSVVTHMFDSTWSIDALTETTLHTAKLPAKIFVRDAQGHVVPYTGPMPGRGVDVPDIPVLVRQPWPGALIEGLPSTSPSRQSLCYIVRNHPRRGKVNAAKVAQLGVDKREIRNLLAGKNVLSANGDTVTPDMVVSPPIEGAGFAVVDLPDRSYIDGFLARPEWANAAMLHKVDTMFWLLGPGVIGDPRVQAFMKDHADIRHTVAATDASSNRLALSSAAALQAKHHRIDPERFPLQQYDNTEPEGVGLAAAHPGGLYVPARAGWSLRLAPQVLEEDDQVFPFVDFETAVSEIGPDVLALADDAQKKTTDPAFQEAAATLSRELPHPDAEVIPLGTGSALPSKYRNVSATLLRVPGVGSYLFDCGENTLGTIRRLFGPEAANDVLRDLKLVWISHMHADHHLGLASLLRAWKEATATKTTKTSSQSENQPRLAVASHNHMLLWLREYAAVEDFGFSRLHLIRMDQPAQSSYVCPPVELSAEEQAEFGLRRIEAVRVNHCFGAMAMSMTFADPDAADSIGNPFKVAYSGDCRPSADFVNIGQGATLLIHESTFDDELRAEAIAKKHSTMGEALDVARKMQARRVLLTHFSQRYPKIPLFGETVKMGLLVAFDQMRVRLADFATAMEYLPALQKLYEGDERS